MLSLLWRPDRPSQLQQTPYEELIPGLQTSSVDSTPQEDGKALFSSKNDYKSHPLKEICAGCMH